MRIPKRIDIAFPDRIIAKGEEADAADFKSNMEAALARIYPGALVELRYAPVRDVGVAFDCVEPDPPMLDNFLKIVIAIIRRER